MRRALAVLGMVGALVALYLLNVWYAEALRRAGTNFRMDDLWWLSSLLPLVTATVALGLGWVVLRARRPDPLVGLIYVIVGLPVVFAMPIWMTSGVALQEWLPLPDLLAGQQLAVWEAAAIAVIGLAELARWVGSRRTQAISRPSVVTSPHPAPDATPL
jgi:hypothetical protein